MSRNGFDGGTVGNTVSVTDAAGPGDDQFNTVTIGTSCTATYYLEGGADKIAGAFVCAATSANCRARLGLAASTTALPVSARAKFRIAAFPGVNTVIMTLLDSTTAVIGIVKLTTAGKILLQNKAATTLVTSALTLSSTAEFAIDFAVLVRSATVGQLEARIYSINPDGTVPNETLTSAATVDTTTTGNNTQFVDVGIAQPATNTTINVIDVQIVAATYPGPYLALQIPTTPVTRAGRRWPFRRRGFAATPVRGPPQTRVPDSGSPNPRTPPFARRRGKATQPVPPQVVVVVAPKLPPDANSPRPRAPFARRRRATEPAPPVQFYIAVVQQHGRRVLPIWPPRLRQRRAQPVPAPVVVTATPVVEQRRTALRVLRPRRAGRAVQVPPPQVVTVAPWTPDSNSPRPRSPWPRRHRQPETAITVTVGATPVVPQAKSSLRTTGRPRRRGRATLPVPVPTVTVTTTPVVEQRRTSQRVPWLSRGKPRQAQPVQTPPVVTVTAAFVPQPARPRRAAWPVRRKTHVARPPTSAIITVVVDQPRRARTRLFALPRRRRVVLPVPPQVITPPPPWPVQPPVRRRQWFRALLRGKPRQSQPVPPQVIIPPVIDVNGRVIITQTVTSTVDAGGPSSQAGVDQTFTSAASGTSAAGGTAAVDPTADGRAGVG